MASAPIRIPEPRPPAARRLRVYAFDPAAALDLGTVNYSQAVISLPWDDSTDGELSAGPVNDYVEVIDADPSSGLIYPPIDLNDPKVLAQDGLAPTEGDPRFHQQMVFAIVMKTIKLFERALGRKVLWAPYWDTAQGTYVQRRKLRVYPHALREANAYYDKGKCALLFGYFRSEKKHAGANWVFTALSHDIIVHETTHAILDGVHGRFSEATNPDSLAFHEAFADIAALFSHFQLYDAVYDFIDTHSGELDDSSLLTGLAQQFAAGTTQQRALRDFIDKTPNPDLLEGTIEPHERGSILVAAVFDAFLAIYKRRTGDLQRLARTHPGAGERLHPDFTARLTAEAGKAADHVLRMCIRALDYMPPFDIRFGEFLRAVITADSDLIPDDRMGYRLAFVQAFRARGIYADDCMSMSPDSLLWEGPGFGGLADALQQDAKELLLQDLELTPLYDRKTIAEAEQRNAEKVWLWLIQPDLVIKDASRGDQANKDLRAFLVQARTVMTQGGAQGDSRNFTLPTVSAFLDESDGYLAGLGLPKADRAALRKDLHDEKRPRRRWLIFFRTLQRSAQVTSNKRLDDAWSDALGVYFLPPGRLGTINRDDGRPRVEIHSVRTTRRAGPDGQDVRQLVVEITQRRRAFLDPKDQLAADKIDKPKDWTCDFTFRGGATLIIDLRDWQVRYVIRKRIDDDQRLDRHRAFLGMATDMSFTYTRGRTDEPFALMHRH